MKTVDQLLERRPERWGLRGDPRLWDALVEHLRGRPIPDDEFDLRQVLEKGIAEIIGVELPVSVRSESEQHSVESFRVGSGMSDGRVSLHWWRHTGIPILTDRAAGVRGVR
ncbi:hypothetical protein [Nocardia sp. NPDC006630]|uniref:hypothetical protein n=1 Tax=Nocardia sp. NPDC006630 TaxID=3157181 RepID=UPI0033B33601